MSEFTSMASTVPWPISYGLFTLALVVIGFLTYLILRYIEKKSLLSQKPAEKP
jgi:magnesium transporter